MNRYLRSCANRPQVIMVFEIWDQVRRTVLKTTPPVYYEFHLTVIYNQNCPGIFQIDRQKGIQNEKP